MGGSKKYLEEGGFTEQTFKQIGTTPNGIKILKPVDSKSSKTPSFSNTPGTMYAATDSRTGATKQISVYGNGNDKRAKLKDIDTGHSHTNPDGKVFHPDEIHVQSYYFDSDGTLLRSKWARKPSKKERRLLMVARYGK